MIDETTDWDELTPREKLESQRGRYLIATALHYAVQQISRFPEVRRAGSGLRGHARNSERLFPPQMAEQFRANDRRWAEIYKPKAVDEGFRPLGHVDSDD